MKLALRALLLAMVTATITGCERTLPNSQAAVETMQARVVQSKQRQLPLDVHSTGTVRAKETAAVSSQIVSRIQQVLVREGDTVRVGQTLAVLDDAAQRDTADHAQAEVRVAQQEKLAAQTDAKLAASTLERYRLLQAEKSVSPQEMDEVAQRASAASARLEAIRSHADAARAQEAGAQAVLGYTRLVAPFAGVVTARMADPGSLASPGVPLLQIDRAGALQLRATIDESAIGAVHKRMKVPIATSDVSSANTVGTVAEIAPAADPSSHSFIVKIDLPPSTHLRSGMYATAEIPDGTRQAITIARSAVVSRGSLTCAYVLDSRGIAQLRYVTLGAAQGEFVEVLSGVTPGERLVDNPSDRDLAGKRIEVQR